MRSSRKARHTKKPCLGKSKECTRNTGCVGIRLGDVFPRLRPPSIRASAAARLVSQGLTGVPLPLRPRRAGQGGKAARRVPKSEPALCSSPRCLDSPPGLARPPAVECVSAMCHRPRLWENAAPLTSQQLARARPPGSRETGAARPGGRPGPLPSARRLSAHTPVPARDPGLRRHPQRVAQHALLLPPLALCILLARLRHREPLF